MAIRNLNNRVDYQFDLQNDSPSIVLNDSGDILAFNMVKYVSMLTPSVSAIIPPIVSRGINLILESECPPITSPFQYGHLEFVLSYNAMFVKDGAVESDVLYRFQSVDLDGWFVEKDAIYDMPGTGYDVDYVTYRYKVKYIATGLDLDLTIPIYFYCRARFLVETLGEYYLTDTYSSYIGKILDTRESYFSNTGSRQVNQIVVPLLPAVSDYWVNPWPSGRYVHYELYVGKYGSYDQYESTGSWELYRDSSINPTGFYYFNDLSMVGFGELGIPSAKEWNKAVFITDELDTEKALFAVYRAKWSDGQTGWISQNLNLVDYVSGDLTKSFHPSSEIMVRANTFGSRYDAHVIVGTSPNLVDYFEDEDTDDFSKIIYSFPGLIEYSYTGNNTDMNRFYYYENGSVTNNMPNGFDNTVDTEIVYMCSQNYVGEEKLYVFWRFETGVSSSSSSSSCSYQSSSCSSCSCSSSSSCSSWCSSSCSRSSCSSSSCCSSWCSSSESSSSCSCSSSSSSSSAVPGEPPCWPCEWSLCGSGATPEEALTDCAASGGCISWHTGSCSDYQVVFDGYVYKVYCCSSDFPGSGWYCAYFLQNCNPSTPFMYHCELITTQEQWDSWHFNECIGTVMSKTNGIVHATYADCVAAGCGGY